ncbi:MAG: VOC family protein [Cyanobacteria bacterium P01_E01_bin.48]
MRLNQVTLPASDLAVSVPFYQRLGLALIVDAQPRYARFQVPGNDASLSLHRVNEQSQCQPSAIVYFECDDLDAHVSDLQNAGIALDSGPRDETWLWREARLKDPDQNVLCFHYAGDNRLFPPWRVDSQST